MRIMGVAPAARVRDTWEFGTVSDLDFFSASAKTYEGLPLTFGADARSPVH